MFEVTVDETFAAGHALRGYKGKCENPHGHNYKVRVILSGKQLDSIGLLYDFKDVKQIIGATVDRLDHQFINDIAPFDAINPSAENLAKYFYDESTRLLGERRPGNGVKVTAVTVWETDTTTATYTPD
jgi:6-pyruvoyltetrahydropterin/6-carboxytetrahydropterin synthase